LPNKLVVLFLAFFLVSLTQLPLAPKTEAKERTHLTIMSTSDLHGFIRPGKYTGNSPAHYGLAKIATLVKQVRQKDPDAILLDSGDTIQGSPMEYYHARIDNSPVDPMMLVMNHLRYSAMAIGNHEYNYGRKVMEKAMNEARFPWLAANTLKKGTGDVYTKPYHIIRMKSGLKLGVLGLTTQQVPNWEEPKNIAHVDFIDVVDAAKKWVPVIKQQEKADVILVSYHGGLEHKKEVDGTITPLSWTNGENQAYQLATQVEGIDVILAGHMHTPVPDVRVNGVLITEPNKWGTHLSVVDLELENRNGRWTVIDKKAKLLEASTAPPDPEVLRLTEEYERKTREFLNRPVGKVRGDMTVRNHHWHRTHDNALIEFINKVQMEASGASISSTALFDNTVPGFPEQVATRHILATYIYPNTLKVIRVKGADIKAALERSATYFKQNGGKDPVEVNPRFTTPKAQHYNYDMWEGIRYTIDVSRPEGSRITGLTDLSGNPIEMDKEYDVALNNYRAGGGGGYSMFAGKPVVKDINLEISELITKYIRKRDTVEATVDNNWKIVGGKVD
jgi:2',3'-cyclic-nucleotide 2'-phosphodiesterase / 3'-nucleotidase